MAGRTRIKICGVKDIETARACAEAGADAIGLNFAKSSPRYIEPSEAWRIVADAPPFLTTVGVFAGVDVDGYCEIEEQCPTDFGQIHAVDDENVFRQCGPRIFKAVRFDASTIENEFVKWCAIDEIDAILVDAAAGGAGETLDWNALAGVRDKCTKPMILAGGLTPDNVVEAIRVVRPYAVDVASGVERERGVKEAALIKRFCDEVRSADRS